MSSTSVIAGIRACVGSTCEVTTNRGLRLVRTELAKTQTRSTKAELDRLHSDLLLGPVEGSRPLTRSQKRVLPGISVLGGQSAASSSHEPAHRPPPTAPKRRRASTSKPPQPVRVPPSPPHAPPQAFPVDHAPPPPVVFDAPASIPHQHGLAETWDLVEERDVTDSFQSLRVEAHHHIGRQAFGVPGAVGKSVFCPETNCRVHVKYAHCHDCLVPHCKLNFRFC